MLNIEDLNKLIPGTTNFYYREFLWLPQWRIHVYPTHTQYLNIIATGQALQEIRDYLKKPMTITSGLRPKIYNHVIKGAILSTHMSGMAADFMVKGIKSDRVRTLLLPVLSDFNIRMEDKSTPHVHIDTRDTGISGKRYFKP